MSFGTKTITLYRAISLALILACLLTLLMPWLGMFLYGYSVGIGVMKTGVEGSFTSFWSVMLIINAILFLLFAALAIFGLIRDVKLLTLPLAALGLIMFFLALFQKIFISHNGYNLIDIHLGAGPWLLLPLSLLACAASLLDNIAAGKKPVDLNEIHSLGIKLPAKTVRAAGWTCPTCGAAQQADMRFCDRCGTKKPEPPRCPNCGKLYQPGEAFCAECGTKL